MQMAGVNLVVFVVAWFEPIQEPRGEPTNDRESTAIRVLASRPDPSVDRLVPPPQRGDVVCSLRCGVSGRSLGSTDRGGSKPRRHHPAAEPPASGRFAHEGSVTVEA